MKIGWTWWSFYDNPDKPIRLLDSYKDWDGVSRGIAMTHDGGRDDWETCTFIWLGVIYAEEHGSFAIYTDVHEFDRHVTELRKWPHSIKF